MDKILVYFELNILKIKLEMNLQIDEVIMTKIKWVILVMWSL